MLGNHSKRGPSRSRVMLASVFALAVALFTASAVYAGLTAQATGTEQVSSGTLNLTLTTGDQGSGSRAPSPARWPPVTWTTSM